MTTQLHQPQLPASRRTGCFDLPIACCLAGLTNVTGLALILVIALV